MSEDIDDLFDQETFGSQNDDDWTSAADFQCEFCKDKLNNPRVLECLHVFCQACIQKQLDEPDENGDKVDDVTCPSCAHKTKMDGKAASSLMVAFVNANLLDMDAVRSNTVVCTSCKSQDDAVSRCADCANFLCSSCNQAHQVMRCFENHKVHSLEELKETVVPIPIHKPVICNSHPAETIKFYCLKCQEPACSECVTEHKLAEHPYERVSEAVGPIREELRELVDRAKERIASAEDTLTTLSSSLSELQANHDNARSLIEETFQSYKAVLEAVRDNSLEELTRVHNQKEIAAMEIMSKFGSSLPHTEMAIAFTNALVELGDAAELLTSNRLVRDRLQGLLAISIDPDIDVAIDFESNLDEFKLAVEKTFGKLKAPEPVKSETSPEPTVPSSGLPMISNVNGTNASQSIISTGSAGLSLLGSTISIPTSGIMSSGGNSPTSLKSSCDSDLSALSSPFMHQTRHDIVTPPMSQAHTPSSLSGLTVMAEYNIQQLANLELDVPNTQQSNPFTLSDILGSDLTSDALHNIQQLAKMNGTGSYNDHNGHSQHMLENCYGNMSQSSGLSDMNGYHGMNGLDDYNRQINQMPMGRRMGSVNSVNGMQNMSSAMAAMYTMNCPMPRPTGNANSLSVRHKYGQLGSAKGQFNSPHGFCLGNDEEVIVADTNNHRIQVFEKDGSFKYQFGTAGREEGQLWYPRKVAFMKKCGRFVVCDRGNERSRMQLFTKNGHFVRKINIKYIDIVAGLAVTNDGFIVAVDSVSPCVFILSENGDTMKWFDCSNFMREPSDIAISGDEFFVCDFKGHCVVVFNKDGAFDRRIGGEGVTNFPNGIDVSEDGDVLVGDSHGNRFHVSVFNREGEHRMDVECPYVKVSRCCGLKLTRNGMIVTLAKNNHHVLILSSLC